MEKTLLKKLKLLGYPLFEKEESLDVNATLAEVVQSRDLRLWEGFPLLLANSTERGLFDYDMVKWHLKKPFDKLYLSQLVLMSLALYEVLNVKFSWANKLYNSLTFKKKDYDEMLGKLKKGEELQVANKLMSPERLKNTFKNYFKEEESKLTELASMKEEFGLEYALSQVFSPKQKELFLKKLRGEKMTKTEREYYSRVVRKKVEALANPELYRLAQKVK